MNTDASDPWLTLPQIGKALGIDRRRIWEDAEIRAVATVLESGHSVVRLSTLNRLGFPITLDQVAAIKSRTYSRAELDAAISTAIAARDAEWLTWYRSPKRRYEPNGPGTVGYGR